MYYIPPVTENPHIKKQIKSMLADTSLNETFPIEQHKSTKKHKVCTSIEIFLLILFLFDIFIGFYFAFHNINLTIYHFVNEDVTPIIYLIAYLTLSVCKEYPDLASIQDGFYFKFYIFFLIYTAFCNVLTSYQINGYILFIITGFGLAILYLRYFIRTSDQALNSFLETTTHPASHSKM